jgi:Ran GTPase-activating protein (RanGAP) involved in mRNA processing and transport
VEAVVFPGTSFTLAGVVDVASMLQIIHFKDYPSQSLLFAPLFPGAIISPPPNRKSALELQIENQRDLIEGRFCEMHLNDLYLSYVANEVGTNNTGGRWEALNFYNNEISSDGPIHIRRILAQRKITTLNLGKNQLGSEGVRKLTRSSGKHGRCNEKMLKSLVLFDNNIDETATNAISRICQCFPSLTNLNLAVNPLGLEGLQNFIGLLHVNQNLTVLDLWDTKLGIAGAMYLAKMLPKTKLNDLNIGTNAIGDVGCVEILHALPDTLTSLNLYSNNITELSVKGILQSIHKKRQLHTLILNGQNPIIYKDECTREIRITAAHRLPFCDVNVTR